eukprot:959662-Amphidinium_carterae.1
MMLCVHIDAGCKPCYKLLAMYLMLFFVGHRVSSDHFCAKACRYGKIQLDYHNTAVANQSFGP